MKFYLVVISLFIGSQLFSQVPGGTDIYLSECNLNGAVKTIAPPINITRRMGYDNQPSFAKGDTAIYYVAVKEDGQADVYSYSIALKTTSQITKTFESEYSPKVNPDGKGFSVVRVEKDSAQLFWQYNVKEVPLLRCKNIDSIGYYNWVNDSLLAFFKVTTIPTLWLANMNTCSEKLLAAKIGRSIQTQSSHEFYYTQLQDSVRWIVKMDISSGKEKRVIACLIGSEDFALTQDHNFIMGMGSKLYFFNPSKSKEWKEIADFEKYGVKNIKRISISTKGDKIAFVNDAQTP